MQIRINHQTIYRFSEPVFLEPHYLRFQPRPMPYLSLDTFQLSIQPPTQGLQGRLGPENNFIHFAWFDGLHSELRIQAIMEVSCLPYNPFQFLIYPAEFTSLPFHYPDSLQKRLYACLQTTPLSESLMVFLQSIRSESQNQTVDFLTELTRRIHTDLASIYRETGPPMTPEETFKQGKGSCRDLSWMQIHLLRQLGLAARFVSGYLYLDVEEPSYELHAWVEVFLPGGGWVGLDPTHGMLVGNNHIPVAASAQYAQTMPVTGSIRGEAQTELLSDLHMERFTRP